MKIRVFPSQLHGSISPPTSKSVTHRGYILAALVGEGRKVHFPLNSADTNATLSVLRGMGAEVRLDGRTVIFDEKISHGVEFGDCMNSGTSLRLLTGIASLFPEKSVLTGDSSLLKRPIGPLSSALRELGVRVEDQGGLPPVEVTGPFPTGSLSTQIASDSSSQFISSLLIAAAGRRDATEIKLIGEPVSKPYIDLTVMMLREGGSIIHELPEGYLVEGSFIGSDYTIPSDFSSIAFYAVAGALSGNDIAVSNVSEKYPQADSAIMNFLKMTGSQISLVDGTLKVSHSSISPLTLDLRQSPDIFPILSVLLSHAEGKSVLGGASHLRLKETDRIKTVVSMLSAMGVDISETNDGCIINGDGHIPGGGVIHSHGDHRIAMAGIIAAASADRPVIIENVECIDVSFPNFLDEFRKVGGVFEVITD